MLPFFKLLVTLAIFLLLVFIIKQSLCKHKWILFFRKKREYTSGRSYETKYLRCNKCYKIKKLN